MLSTLILKNFLFIFYSLFSYYLSFPFKLFVNHHPFNALNLKVLHSLGLSNTLANRE